MVYNVPTIQMVIVDVGVELLDFYVTHVIVVTMGQIQKVDVKVREFSTNKYMQFQLFFEYNYKIPITNGS